MVLQPGVILEEGGMKKILRNKNLLHISTEDLNYLEILESTKGDKDLWGFLLGKALASNNTEEINAMGNNSSGPEWMRELRFNCGFCVFS